MRHTKIIATVGPASDSDDMLDALIAAGTDVFRLNFSHGTHESQAATFARIRAAARRARREVGVLQDLGGPKIRTGTLEGGRPIRVKPGERLAIETGDFPGRPGHLSTAFAALARAVRPGDRLLLADGSVELRVDRADGTTIETTVIEGGEIGEHKGINAPGVPLPTSAITPKDIDDLRFGLALGVDMIALRFVETAAGAYPARAVQTLDAIIRDAELIPKLEAARRMTDSGHHDHAQALCEAALTLANRGDAQAIVAITRGGTTARRLSALRPQAPIIAATQREDTARRLALYWGVVPLCLELGENLDEASARVGVQLVERGVVPSGGTAVFVSISADLTRGDANYLKIQRL